MGAAGAKEGLPIALVLVVVQSLLASAVQGQVVRGRLVAADADSTAIAGAMTILTDREGRGVDRAISRIGTGRFELRAPRPGEYRVRAERIGYKTVYSAYYDIVAGDTLAMQLVTPVEPISLEGIDAAGGPRCHVRPEEGLVVARVWEEARKALAVASWTQKRGLYRYEMLRMNRYFDKRGQRVRREDRELGQALVSVPYVARDADSLVYGGFARFSTEASEFWGPDAGVLLSDAFLDTHCLRLGSGGGELVGLEFEPVPNRRVADIAGTMWLDAATAALQRVDYRYVNLPVPRRLMEATPGGVVRFQGLPDGTWIIPSWHIRMFLAGEAEHFLTGRPVATLDGVATTHGEVLRAHGDAGVVFEGEEGRRVEGTVVDSLGEGLPNARVHVTGSGAEAGTDAQGRFRLGHLAAGTYELYVTHPYLERLWYESEPVEVEIEPDPNSVAEVRFEAPSRGDVLSDVCGRRDAPAEAMVAIPDKEVWRTGVLSGRVADEEGGPARDAKVLFLARAFDPGRISEPKSGTTHRFEDERSRWRTESDATGFYRMCWLPADIPIEVVVLGKDEDIDRGALDATLSLTDLFGGRVGILTIDPGSPNQVVDLRLFDRRPPG